MQNFPISAAQHAAIREQAAFLSFGASIRPALTLVESGAKQGALTVHQLAAKIFADKYADETFITCIDVLQRLDATDREQAAALAKAMGGDTSALRRLYLKLAKVAAHEEASAQVAGKQS